MRVAVTSQNRKTITQHAGKCRNFWIYDVDQGEITGKALISLTMEQSFHESHGAASHPLDGIDVLIAGSMGEGLYLRLSEKGVRPLITDEGDPDVAVNKMLLGLLRVMPVGGAGCDHAH
jgi:predicted Fe-Mo cluster-binding NifX family protein